MRILYGFNPHACGRPQDQLLAEVCQQDGSASMSVFGGVELGMQVGVTGGRWAGGQCGCVCEC